ncbi:hypothetical protein FRC07_009576 [Ceratobasidium sp. 392]|nr:hypothetical protein FRC07_009576 [Ceratobasidium sp. 392]
MSVPGPDPSAPYTWPSGRLLASLQPGKAEARIYGPLDRVMNDLLVQGRPHTKLGGWMLKPQPSLRGRQAGFKPAPPPEDEEEEEDFQPGASEEDGGISFGDDDAGNASVGNITIDSQCNPVNPGRHLAKRPDFAVAWATKILTGDVHHLYIEVKNGKADGREFEDQMRTYLRYALRAIPPTMKWPVYFLLLNGSETLVWTLKCDTVIGYGGRVLKLGERIPTMGDKWWKLMKEVAGRNT